MGVICIIYQADHSPKIRSWTFHQEWMDLQCIYKYVFTYIDKIGYKLFNSDLSLGLSSMQVLNQMGKDKEQRHVDSPVPGKQIN